MEFNGINAICIYPKTNNINKKLNLKSYDEKFVFNCTCCNIVYLM